MLAADWAAFGLRDSRLFNERYSEAEARQAHAEGNTLAISEKPISVRQPRYYLIIKQQQYNVLARREHRHELARRRHFYMPADMRRS